MNQPMDFFKLRKQQRETKASSLSSSQHVDIHVGLLKRFQAFLLNQKLIKLNCALKRHCGRHYPIGYKPEFGFHQYWEDKKYKYQQSNISQYFQYPHWYCYILAFLILLSKICMMWTISVHRLFQMDTSNSITVQVWGLITIICDIALQYELFSHYEYFKDGDILKYCKSFWKDMLLIAYFTSIPLHYSNYNQYLLFMDAFITILLSVRCEQIKRSFQLKVTSTSYKDAFNVIELFTTLIPIAHLFALILYYVTISHPEKNWLNVNDLQDLEPVHKYIYSLYFSFTTMLTVGYGDISPVNIAQIIVIICIQIIGIVTYGYIVNQIGHIIGHMRKEDEILSRDISTISKMAKYYDLDKNLVEKAKNFLVCQKKSKADLTPEEEETTLAKLHDDLRQQISQQNSLRILKSSLFYVCNWTKRFQIQIAKKIHKKIFSPNQEIFQVPGKQRIYIFKKGKVELHANRSSGYKKHFKKILRTIEPNETLEVSDNIYGYSFLMSNTPIKLTAINKEFVVAYYVDKKDFLETVMNSHLDCEYYQQMKTKIDSMSYPQSWQAPLIINTKEHYFPNIQYLIKKNKNSWHREKNVRSSKTEVRRYRNRSKRVFYNSLQEMEGEYIPHVIQMISGRMTSDIKTDKVIPTTKSFEQNQINSLTWLSTVKDPSPFRKQSLHVMFQQGKQYTIYFKRSNRTEILHKIQNSNFMLKPKKNTQTTHRLSRHAHGKKENTAEVIIL